MIALRKCRKGLLYASCQIDDLSTGATGVENAFHFPIHAASTLLRVYDCKQE
jgi:hypothetical protein